MLGLESNDITEKEQKKRKLSNGVIILTSNERNTENRLDNYVITKVNDEDVTSAEEAIQLINRFSRGNNGFTLELINLEGERERLRVR
jgi:ACT domain-containing protein